MFSTSNTEEVVTLDFIYSKITPLEIFSKYLGASIVVDGPPVTSILRKDSKPSLGVFQGSKSLMFKDLGTGDSGDCICLVQKYYRVSRHKAIQMIAKDFNLHREKQKNKSPVFVPVIPTIFQRDKEKSIIKVAYREWNKSLLQYWEDFGVSKEILNYYSVKPIKYYWVGEIMFTAGEFAFAFYFQESKTYKIYQPFNVLHKWTSNTPYTTVQGYKQLPKTGKGLFITKALKDVCTLRGMGYSSVAPQSETTKMPLEVLEDLKKRFSIIVVLFDNDEAGIKAALKYKEFKKIFIPKYYRCKDISDYTQVHGPKRAKNLIIELLTNEKTNNT
jgi:hypothetical protein